LTFLNVHQLERQGADIQSSIVFIFTNNNPVAMLGYFIKLMKLDDNCPTSTKVSFIFLQDSSKKDLGFGNCKFKGGYP